MTFDTHYMVDGNLTVAATLTNGAGNSGATTVTTIKDTILPALSVSAPYYVNNTNASGYQAIASGEPGATIGYTITDGKTTITNSKGGTVPSSGKWNVNVNLSKFNNGPVTLTVTEIDPAGNPTVVTTNLYEMVQSVATPTVALNSLSDSGYLNSDYITNVAAPLFTTADATAGTTVAVYVNGVAYTGQTLAAGSYTITAIATDQYGNVSSAATAPKTLVIVTSPPTGSWTVSGGKVINGVLSTSSKTPTLTLSFTDPGGIYQMATSTNGGSTWSTAVAYASSTTVSLAGGDGLYTVVVKLIDAAGNVGTYSQTIRLDTTGPAISHTISAPQSTSIGYDGTSDITISAGATDVSGVSSIKIVLDSTTTMSTGVIDVDTLLAGNHTIVITAVDGLGNNSTQTVTFQLHPSRNGIGNAVNEGVTGGVITSGEGTKLLSILNNSSNALSTDLTSFINEVKNQSGKAITAAEANILINWAQDDQKTLY
jgi:hypothetical protein